MTLSHFSAVLLYAFFVSIVFGITQRTQPRKMALFAAYCFGLFVVGTVVASWVMWLIKR
jgi:putative Mn2+ efflux pump MntP